MEPQRNIRVEVRLDPLIDEAYRFVTAKWPRTNPRDALGDLGSTRNRFLPIEVLEQMVLAGTPRRDDVAEFVAFCFNPEHFDVR